MRPKTDTDHEVLEEIDKAGLEETREHIEEWAPSVVEKLKYITPPEGDIRFLANRDKQIWKPLLAVAKVTSDAWYERALKAARFFTDGQETEKTLTHNILRG
jgi:hypothetical protein